MNSASFFPGIEWMVFFALFAIAEDIVWRNFPKRYIARCFPLFTLGRISAGGIGAAERRDRFEIMRGIEAKWITETLAVLYNRWDSWFAPGPLRFSAEGSDDYLLVRVRVAWWWFLAILLIPAHPFVFLLVCCGSLFAAVGQWRRMAEDLTDSRKKDV